MSRIHRNLHNAKAGGPQWVHTVSGKVEAYLEQVHLTDVTTRIQPAGARKCAASGVRSVVAFFDGAFATTSQVEALENVDDRIEGWHRVAYDPRTDDAFLYLVTDEPAVPAQRWNAADAVALTSSGRTYVLRPRWQA